DDRGAGDADAGRHGGVVAYAHVVRHHDLVVELDPVADDGVFEGAAVDGGVGADLDVVAYLDPAQLSDFSPGARLAARIRGKTEAVGAQHRAAVHNDPVAQVHAVVKRYAGVQQAVGPDGRAGADDAARPHACARPDARAVLDDAIG